MTDDERLKEDNFAMYRYLSETAVVLEKLSAGLAAAAENFTTRFYCFEADRCLQCYDCALVNLDARCDKCGKEDYRERQAKAIKYAGGKCKDCGLEPKIPGIMEFHHRDPRLKLVNVSWMLSGGVSWPIVLAEIAKCDLLCCNCHKMRHYQPEIYAPAPVLVRYAEVEQNQAQNQRRKPVELLHSQRRASDQRLVLPENATLEELERLREEAIRRQDFETAAAARARIDALRKTQ